MGRGRAKAKQIKVARKLKYSAPDTDLTALERELRGDHSSDSSPTHDDGGDDEDDPYADYSAYGAQEEDEDKGSWHSSGHG